jgi:hypothetical protein
MNTNHVSLSQSVEEIRLTKKCGRSKKRGDTTRVKEVRKRLLQR